MRIALVSRQQFLEMMSKVRMDARWVMQIPATNFYSSMEDVLYLVKEDTTMIKFQDEQVLTFQIVMRAFSEAKGK